MDVSTLVPTNYGGHLAKYAPIWQKQTEELKSRFGDSIEEVRMPGVAKTDLPTIFVKKEAITQVLEYVKSAAGFNYNFLSDITAVDEQANPRFEVVYHLLSHENLARLRFKVRVSENEDVPTLCKIWPAANWAEREVFDMFGIKFSGHPDLRRILMDERWVGYPLRKDYPLRGYQIFPEPQQIKPELLE